MSTRNLYALCDVCIIAGVATVLAAEHGIVAILLSLILIYGNGLITGREWAKR